MHKQLLLVFALAPLSNMHAGLQEIETQLGAQAAALGQQRKGLESFATKLKKDVAEQRKLERDLESGKVELAQVEQQQEELGPLEKAFIMATMRETKHVGDRAIKNQKELFKNLDGLLEKA